MKNCFKIRQRAKALWIAVMPVVAVCFLGSCSALDAGSPYENDQPHILLTINVTVVDKDGAPIKGVKTTISDTKRTVYIDHTDTEGAASCEAELFFVDGAEYTVRAVDPDDRYDDTTAKVVVAKNEPYSGNGLWFKGYVDKSVVATMEKIEL